MQRRNPETEAMDRAAGSHARDCVPAPLATELLSFPGFTLDTAARLLHTQHGQPVELRRSEYDLLLAFVRHPNRALTRDQLRDAVVGRPLEAFDRSIDVLVGRLRKKIEARPSAPQLIVTVPGVGYRFTTAVSSVGLPDSAPCEPIAVPRAQTPERTSITITPLRCQGDARVLDDLSIGLEDELALALSRFPSLFAVHQGEPAATGGFTLLSSVRTDGERLRVLVRLIDQRDGTQVFAERIEDDADGGFDLQDRIVARVVARLESALRLHKIRRARSRSRETLDVADHYFLSLAANYEATPASLARALELALQATQLHPHSGLAKAFFAFLVAMRQSQSQGTEEEVRHALAFADESIRLASDDPLVLRYAGHAQAYLGRHHEHGVALLEKAIQRNPYSVQIVAGNAWAHTYACHTDVAIRRFKQALALNPCDAELPSVLSGLALASFVAGDYEAALSWSRRCIAENPGWARGWRFAAMALSHLGRIGEAETMGRRMLDIAPAFRIEGQINPLHTADAARRFTRGLELAGLPH